MCGILFARSVDPYAPSREALEALLRRGPDELQTLAFQHPVSKEHINWACSRLKLVNLQPGVLLYYKDWTMAYNGEIYKPEQYLPEDQCEISDGMVLFRTLVDAYDTYFPDQAFFYERVEHLYSMIRGSFAFVMYNSQTETVLFGRDFYGIRPLYVTRQFHALLQIASLVSMMHPFPEMTWMEVSPGSLWVQHRGEVPFQVLQLPTYQGKLTDPAFCGVDLPTLEGLAETFVEAVELRLLHNAQRPIGFALSGGLDSGTIFALCCKLLRDRGRVPAIEFHVFTMGDSGSPDVIAARQLVEYCGMQSQHHIIPFPDQEDLLLLVRNVIHATETVDITTIRASIPHFLLCRYISQNTPVKILLCGEGADELAQGYQYFTQAPSPREADQESRKLLRQIYKADVTRAERCASYWGIEARFPHLDTQFTSYFLRFSPEERWVGGGRLEKALLREMVLKISPTLLPESIRMRKKEAFSDAAFPTLITRLKTLAGKGGILLPPIPPYLKVFMQRYPSQHFNLEMKLYWCIFRGLFPQVPTNLMWPFENWRVNVDWFPQELREVLYVEPSARYLPCYQKSEFTSERNAQLQ